MKNSYGGLSLHQYNRYQCGRGHEECLDLTKRTLKNGDRFPKINSLTGPSSSVTTLSFRHDAKKYCITFLFRIHFKKFHCVTMSDRKVATIASNLIPGGMSHSMLLRVHVVICILLSSSGALSLDRGNRAFIVPTFQQLRPTRLSLMTRGGSDEQEGDYSVDPKREIKVSTTLDLPFDAEIAFDAFSDLPRQAEFSPWLRKVEYLVPPDEGVDRIGKSLGETKWYVGFRGFSFTWNAISTRLERPHLIEWESTSGMKNGGRVDFESKGANATTMTLTMTFVAPRFVASFFQRSSKLAAFVETRMLRATLVNFRDIMIEKDLAPGPTRPY